MIKLSFCLRRLPHLSHAEFLAYWLDNHGPLVRKHAEVLRIRRYVQVHGMENEVSEAMRRSRGGAEPFDGIAELWFDSTDELGANADDPASRRARKELVVDEQKFIDLPQSPLWIGTEHVLVE